MQQLILPGIEFAPGKVRRHGLREFHTYPLVSPGKDAAGVWGGSWRVPAAEAWTFPELELGRTGNSHPGFAVRPGRRPNRLAGRRARPRPAPAELDCVAPGEYARPYCVHPRTARAHGRTGETDAPSLPGPRRRIHGRRAESRTRRIARCWAIIPSARPARAAIAPTGSGKSPTVWPSWPRSCPRAGGGPYSSLRRCTAGMMPSSGRA